MEPLIKLAVFVPASHADQVRLALGEAGAGHIGNYDFCSFVSAGTGHYRPGEGTNPYKGAVGEIETVQELRIETVCTEALLPAVLAAMRDAHPYEEVAYDLIPLVNHQYTHLVPKQQ